MYSFFYFLILEESNITLLIDLMLCFYINYFILC